MTEEKFNDLKDKIAKVYENMDYNEVMRKLEQLNVEDGIQLNGWLFFHLLDKTLELYNYDIVRILTILKENANTDNGKEYTNAKISAINEIRAISEGEFISWEEEHKDEIAQKQLEIDLNSKMINSKYNEDNIFEEINHE